MLCDYHRWYWEFFDLNNNLDMVDIILKIFMGLCVLFYFYMLYLLKDTTSRRVPNFNKKIKDGIKK